MIYPTHTPVSAITRFDRSTKVVIQCSLDGHEDSVWMTKQPSCSNWFEASNATLDCGCSVSGGTWWTYEEYDDGNEETAGQVYGAIKLSGVMTEPELVDYRMDVFDGDTLVAVFADEEDAATYVSVINNHLGTSYYFKAHAE